MLFFDWIAGSCQVNLLKTELAGLFGSLLAPIWVEVDESSSENNIIVDGIKDFPGSPHDVNKKAYIFRMGKGANYWYSLRLSLNMYKLPHGEYTICGGSDNVRCFN